MNELHKLAREQAHQNPDERSEIAQRVTELRQQFFAEKNKLSEEARSLGGEIDKITESLDHLHTQLQLLEAKQNSYSESIVHKVIGIFSSEDPIQARMDKKHLSLHEAINNCERTFGQLTRRVDEIREQLANQAKLAEARNLVHNFYEETSRNFLSPEQKKEFFTFENLAKLNTNEFMELWRAGSPYYLSHVTRFGFRDHNAMIYHSSGMGEFHDGAETMMADKRVRSPNYLNGLTDFEPATIQAFLEKNEVFKKSSKTEAWKYFRSIMEWSLGSAPKYPDKTAVHLAAQTVLDDYYGCESGNEVFCVFPADAIASQTDFAFNGWQKTFKAPQSEDKWNDVFAWTGDQEGLPLDAGLVFLPAKTLVDPDTGSVYASQEVRGEDGKVVRERIKNSETQAAFLVWWETEKSNLEEIYKSKQEIQDYFSRIHVEDSLESAIRAGLLSLGATRVAQGAIEKITNYFYRGIDFTQKQEDVESILDSSGLLFEQPTERVESQVFWEQYFLKHPDSKPQHVVYYTGDPSKAVKDFLGDHNIAPKADKPDPELLGFDQNHITDMADDPKTNQGKTEIYAIAEQLIEEHYIDSPVEEPEET